MFEKCELRWKYRCLNTGPGIVVKCLRTNNFREIRLCVILIHNFN